MALSTQLTQLVADTIKLTKRPDLQDRTVLAVKAATRKIHLSDFYFRDLTETGVSFNDALFIQQFNVKELFPRFRHMKAVRKLAQDVVTGVWSGTTYLKEHDPSDMLDNYSIAREDVFYIAGDMLNLRSSTAEDKLLLSFYQYPELSDDKFATWIFHELPEAIYTEAAGIVFKSVGYDEQAAMIRNDAATYLLQFRNSNLYATGA